MFALFFDLQKWTGIKQWHFKKAESKNRFVYLKKMNISDNIFRVHFRKMLVVRSKHFDINQ